ncbi:MAG TPA: aspartate--tRNA ligase [Candidatus Nanoarchaeia archaeon]|nr:aspartate--tRNA ligase [Candidatus Nanoarchaeia archaeon]
MLRTHTNNDLRSSDIGKTTTLCGWVDSRRDHGGIIFIDLRDRYGLTQIVFHPDFDKATHTAAAKLRREDVLQVTGTIKERAKGMKNANLATGDIEVFISTLNILNSAEMPPMEVDDRKVPSEATRLKYRYLDLRRPAMQQRLLTRHTTAQATREYFNSHNFIEIETPMLLKHTPEGARDYIVPSRVHPGKVYSLPQSPQLYKQTLMIAGFDRYYQLARCLRDEDLREDRQPEFTQIDIEMSFVEEEDIITMCEGLIKHIWKKAANKMLKTPFPRITYDEAVLKYGIDRPDMRFGLELSDVTSIVKDSDFKVFRDVVAKNGIVKCLNAQKANFTRTQIEECIEFAKKHGAAGLAWMKVTDKGLESNIAKFFSAAIQKQLIKQTNSKPNDVLLFVAEKPKRCNDVLSRLRLKLGEDLKLIDHDALHFVWVVDFPMFDYNEEEKRWDAMHHPFTSPKPEHRPYMSKDPGRVKARAYDLVLNGIEIGGGSIRISNPEIQREVLGLLGYNKEEQEQKFGFLLEALKYGAPPHGGLAFGLDRLCALLCGLHDIREVIAFPKTKAGENPMDGSPSAWDDKYLKELHLELDAVAKKNKDQ